MAGKNKKEPKAENPVLVVERNLRAALDDFNRVEGRTLSEGECVDYALEALDSIRSGLKMRQEELAGGD